MQKLGCFLEYLEGNGCNSNSSSRLSTVFCSRSRSIADCSIILRIINEVEWWWWWWWLIYESVLIHWGKHNQDKYYGSKGFNTWFKLTQVPDKPEREDLEGRCQGTRGIVLSLSTWSIGTGWTGWSLLENLRIPACLFAEVEVSCGKICGSRSFSRLVVEYLACSLSWSAQSADKRMWWMWSGRDWEKAGAH